MEGYPIHLSKSIIQEICSALGISRASFYRYLKDAGQEEA